MTFDDVCAVCRVRAVPPDRSVCYVCIPGEPSLVLQVAKEMLGELEGEYLNGVRNGYFPDVGAKLDRWRAALRLPPIERFCNGVADLVAPVVRRLPQDGDVRGPAVEQCGEESPPVQVADPAGRVGAGPTLLPGVREDSSGHGGFDHFAGTRFVRVGAKVKMLPDPLGGQFSTSMTPEQVEYLSRHLARLAAGARGERGRQCPGLFPEDAEYLSKLK